jgi:hypothetical protein
VTVNLGLFNPSAGGTLGTPNAAAKGGGADKFKFKAESRFIDSEHFRYFLNREKSW